MTCLAFSSEVLNHQRATLPYQLVLQGACSHQSALCCGALGPGFFDMISQLWQASICPLNCMTQQACCPLSSSCVVDDTKVSQLSSCSALYA